MTPARLALSGICKRYGSLVANDDVSLSVQPGEIHAVIGENGAGKSTLMKIIYGLVRPDAGVLRWDGHAVTIDSPRSARELGISMVFQHFSLFESLTVAENVLLGLPPELTLAFVRVRLAELSRMYGIALDPDRPLHGLSVGERQRVEIARALMTNPRLLILDEPTSVLTPDAVERLFVTLRKLAEEGCAIVYISHKLDEVRALCTRCTVLRAGRVTASDLDPRAHDNTALATWMVGAAPPALTRMEKTRRAGPAALRVRGLSLAPRDRHGTALHTIELTLHPGEIVGIAGVSGSGQEELVAALSGEDGRIPRGVLSLFESDMFGAAPERRRRAGLRVVPEERLGRGAVPGLALSDNTLLTRDECVGKLGVIDARGLRARTRDVIARFRVKAAGPSAEARSLSGGNLQKFIVGRELDARPRVLIASQPTWGVDVAAAAQIRASLLALRDAGCALLVISEELDELFALCDRLCVLAGGRLSPSVPIAEATVSQVGVWMSGKWPAEGAVAHG